MRQPRRHAVVLGAALLAVASCGGESRPRRVQDTLSTRPLEERPPEQPAPVEDSLEPHWPTECVGVPDDVRQAVMESARAAYGLEAELFSASERVTSLEDVYRHYRRGFGDQLARRLAEYSWMQEEGILRASEPVLFVPEAILVLEADREHAIIAFPAPEGLVQLWGSEPYITDRLQLEAGRWVIVESESSVTRPECP